MLCELFKGKGDSSNVKSYRDILLANDDGKGIMRMIRTKLLPLASSIVLESQYGGGLNGGETAFAQLFTRVVCEAAKQQKLSCACLFIDVVAAFASMLKRIIFDISEGDEAWLAKLAAAGYSKSDIDSIYEFVIDHSNMYSGVFGDCPKGKADAFHFSLAEQWYERAWATQVACLTLSKSILALLQGSLLQTCFTRSPGLASFPICVTVFQAVVE